MQILPEYRSILTLNNNFIINLQQFDHIAQDLEDEEDEDEEDDEDAVAEGVKALSVEEDEQDGLDPITRAAKHRAVVGVLGSHPDSRDLHVHGLTVHYYSHELLSDAKLELNYGTLKILSTF